MRHEDKDISAMDEKQYILNEKNYVKRLDKRLLAFAMFGNMVKTLDNSNLGSAFISGMEEELNITGTQYNWMGVLFMVGYLSMQVPSNILLSKYRPSQYLPLLELVWCILTVSMACVQSVQQVYVIRFILGLFESGFYPGIVFLLGTWYTKHELGKRMALLNLCGAMGIGISGLVQAMMLKTMDGVYGVSGWRWMFLFDAFITLLLAIFGYTFLPDYPTTTTWLSKSEREIAIQRNVRSDTHQHSPKSNPSGKLAKLSLLLGNKYIYPFTVGWAALHISLGAYHVLGIVAKKSGFDPVTANLLTTPDTLITMFFGLCNGFISDQLQSRIWCILIPASFGLIGLMLLLANVQPFGFLYFSFIVTHAGLGSVTSIVMTWASETITASTELRAMAIATMNTFSSLMWTWTPLILWPVTDAPEYHNGFKGATFSTIIFLISMTWIYHMCQQDHNNGTNNTIGKYEPLISEEHPSEDDDTVVLTQLHGTDNPLIQRSTNEKLL